MLRLSKVNRGSLLALTALAAAACMLTAAGAAAPTVYGKDIGIEKSTYVDSLTGYTIVEIIKPADTNEKAYFSNYSTTADDKYLLCRYHGQGIGRVNLETGHIVLLEGDAVSMCIDRTNPRLIYYRSGDSVVEQNIETFRLRTIGKLPRPLDTGSESGGQLAHVEPITQSCDGQWLCLNYPLSQQKPAICAISKMNIKTGEVVEILRGQDKQNITHAQFHPTQPLIFWAGDSDAQRTNVVNADGTGNRPLYEQRFRNLQWRREYITHEAWAPATGELAVISAGIGAMYISLDGYGRYVAGGHFWHGCPSPDGTKMVADDFDGNLWLIDTTNCGTRRLATGLIVKGVSCHPHASWDRAGRNVIFESARSGKPAIYMIDIMQTPAPTPGPPAAP